MGKIFQCVLPKPNDIDELLSIIPKISSDARVIDWSIPLLEYYTTAKRSVEFGSIARTVTNGSDIVGFFAANLVSNASGESLFESQNKFEYWNLIGLVPLGKKEIAQLSTEVGATMVITEFFWNPNLVSKADFTGIALEHIVRWFEGNHIEYVIFSLYARFKPLANLVLCFTPTRKREIRRIEQNFMAIRIGGPWTWENSLGNRWGERLLGERSENTKQIANKLSNREKLIARTLHEFEYDIDQAAPLAWHYDILDVNRDVKRLTEKYPSLKTWRESVAQSVWDSDTHKSFAQQKVVLRELQILFNSELWRLLPRADDEQD